MENLKKLRKTYKLTQAQLGKKIGVAGNSIGQYENGLREPSIDVLIKISEIFNVSVDEILGIKKESANQNESASIIPARLKPILNELLQLNEDGIKAVEMFIKGYIAGSQNDEKINFYN